APYPAAFAAGTGCFAGLTTLKGRDKRLRFDASANRGAYMTVRGGNVDGKNEYYRSFSRSLSISWTVAKRAFHIPERQLPAIGRSVARSCHWTPGLADISKSHP